MKVNTAIARFWDENSQCKDRWVKVGRQQLIISRSATVDAGIDPQNTLLDLMVVVVMLVGDIRQAQKGGCVLCHSTGRKSQGRWCIDI